MTPRKYPRRTLMLARLRRFEEWHEVYLFRGAGNPDHVADIEAGYKLYRMRFVDWMCEHDRNDVR